MKNIYFVVRAHIIFVCVCDKVAYVVMYVFELPVMTIENQTK